MSFFRRAFTLPKSMNSLSDVAQNPLGALSGVSNLAALATQIPGIRLGGALGALGQGGLGSAVGAGGSVGNFLNQYGPALFGAYAAKQAFPNAFKPQGGSGFYDAMQGANEGMAGMRKGVQDMTGWAAQMGDFAAQNLPDFPNQPILKLPARDVRPPASRASQVYAQGIAAGNRAASAAESRLPGGASMPGMSEGLRLRGAGQAQAASQAQRAVDDEAMRIWQERQHEADRQRAAEQYQADLARILNIYQQQMEARRQKAAELALQGDALAKAQSLRQGNVATQLTVADLYRQLMQMSTEQQRQLLSQAPELLDLLFSGAKGSGGTAQAPVPGAAESLPVPQAGVPPWAAMPGWWGNPEYQWISNLRFR